MKKEITTGLLIFGLIVAVSAPLLASSQDDIEAIKKAAKQNSHSKAEAEVKWFKVLITDNKAKKDMVRITLPIFFVEMLIDCADDEPLKIKHDGCEFDLRELFAEMKKMGPVKILEVCEEDHTVKLWLE